MPATLTINEARTLANIQRRAETLFSDGYTAEPFAAGIYWVTSPKGDLYAVTCDEVMGYKCDCECFKSRNTCKHLLAVAKDIRDGEEADRAYEAAEEVRNFFDGRYDF